MNCYVCKDSFPTWDGSKMVRFNDKSDVIRKYIICFSYRMFRNLMGVAASDPIVCNDCKESLKEEAKLSLQKLEKKLKMLDSSYYELDKLDVSSLDSEECLLKKDVPDELKLETLIMHNFEVWLMGKKISDFFLSARNCPLRQYYEDQSAKYAKKE